MVCTYMVGSWISFQPAIDTHLQRSFVMSLPLAQEYLLHWRENHRYLLHATTLVGYAAFGDAVSCHGSRRHATAPSARDDRWHFAAAVRSLPASAVSSDEIAFHSARRHQTLSRLHPHRSTHARLLMMWGNAHAHTVLGRLVVAQRRNGSARVLVARRRSR